MSVYNYSTSTIAKNAALYYKCQKCGHHNLIPVEVKAVGTSDRKYGWPGPEVKNAMHEQSNSKAHSAMLNTISELTSGIESAITRNVSINGTCQRCNSKPFWSKWIKWSSLSKKALTVLVFVMLIVLYLCMMDKKSDFSLPLIATVVLALCRLAYPYICKRFLEQYRLKMKPEDRPVILASKQKILDKIAAISHQD